MRAGILSAVCISLAFAAGCRKDEGNTAAAPAAPGAAGKVLMVVAHENFRDEELLVPKRILEAEGFAVVVASTSLTPARGMLKAEVTPQTTLKDADVADFSAVVFVGGQGAISNWDNKDAHRLAQESVAQGKVTAAICLATGILAKAGVIKGTMVTGWPSSDHERIIREGGATYVKKDVVVDGGIITAPGPEAAEAFGRAIAQALRQ